MTEEKRAIGRPPKYTEEMSKRICDLVATHDMGLPRLCEQYPDLPEQQTINRWRREHPAFSSKYAQAKMEQAELMAESIDDISSDLVNNLYIDNGAIKIDSGLVALARLRIDTRKWLASKLAPKVYGDKAHQAEQSNPQETLTKIAAMVADLNKVNESEI
jgi:hypothetical protein